MAFFTPAHLVHALKVLPGQTHSSLVSLLAMLRSQVPLSSTPSVAFGSVQESELLRDYFLPEGGSPERPWYIPFGKVIAGQTPWRPKYYAGTTLQRMRTDKGFLYKQGAGTSNDLWSLTPDAVKILTERHSEVIGENPLSIHNLAVWLYRNEAFATHQDAINRFIEEFNLVAYAFLKTVFNDSLDPELAKVPLASVAMSPADISKLLSAAPVASTLTTAPSALSAVEAEEEPTWDIDAADIQSAITDMRGVDEAAIRAMAALRAGMHVIFTGPPGTGKTQLAKRLCIVSKMPWTMAAATDQWTTIDTIGGYLPSATAVGQLDFEPGFVTTAIKARRTLIIDEINRADIDKAFGELFTLLSGNSVDLPYLHRDAPGAGGTSRRIRLATEEAADHSEFETIRLPVWWRLIGSMNDADKASLKRLSYAFVRRFAFIPVGIPDQKSYNELISAGAGEGATGLATDRPDYLEILKAVFADPAGLASFDMTMGYAIPEAMMRHARGELALEPSRPTSALLSSSFELFLAPQFQGRAEKHEDLVKLLSLHIKDAQMLNTFSKRLSVWTGFVD